MDVIRGQRWSLQGDSVDITYNLDLTPGHRPAIAAVLVGVDGQAIGAPIDLGASAPDGAVTPVPDRGDTFRVHLTKLASNVERVAFVVAVGSNEMMAAVTLRVLRGGQLLVQDSAGTHVLRVDPSVLVWSQAASCVELYRKNGWRAWFRGEGWAAGADGPLGCYGAAALRWPVVVPKSPDPAPISPDTGGGPLRSASLPDRWPGGVVPALPAGLTGAVAMVLVETAEGTANGTAFFVTPGGLAVTCAHVVRDARSIRLVTEGNDRPRVARLRAIDEEADLALLVPEDDEGTTAWFRVAPPSVARGLGLEVGLFGYPLGNALGLSLTYSQGVINSTRKGGVGKILQLDAGAAPGSSGGPLFRRTDGLVIGVLTSGLREGPSGMLVNFAIDLSVAWEREWFNG